MRGSVLTCHTLSHVLASLNVVPHRGTPHSIPYTLLPTLVSLPFHHTCMFADLHVVKRVGNRIGIGHHETSRAHYRVGIGPTKVASWRDMASTRSREILTIRNVWNQSTTRLLVVEINYKLNFFFVMQYWTKWCFLRRDLMESDVLDVLLERMCWSRWPYTCNSKLDNGEHYMQWGTQEDEKKEVEL